MSSMRRKRVKISHGVDSTTEAICPEGDVIFVIGKDKHILVHSAIMSQASEVFAALLGVQFREGQQPRSPEHPTTIPLPDDEPDAMVDLCSLLHYKPIAFNTSAGDELRLYDLSCAIDKYCCTEALDLQCDALLRRTHKLYKKRQDELCNSWSIELGALSVAAYNMAQPRCFHDFTAEMIMEHTWPFSTPNCFGATGIRLPSNALLMMEEIRGMFRASLLQDIEEKVKEHSDNKGYDIRDACFDHLAGQLGVESWPPPFHSSGGCSLSSIIKTFKNLAPWEAGCCDDCLNEMEIHRMAVQLEKEVVGLCLRCVREDSLSSAWAFENGGPVFDPDACGHDDEAGKDGEVGNDV